ncbi:chalcone isomerase family protein [Bowmanella denitrificans]|uniref:chalcone isomerase family protein n=1 Tax=Bowmanella denitrificans TaxID=366582 RepID=UPI000C99B7EC|nr:chalcone isomerase family protein [Bowmanella denitrificans]
MTVKYYLVLISLLFSLSVQASPISDLKLVGQARLSLWVWDIYDSSLYTADGTYQPERFPQVLQIRYLRDIKAQELLETTAEQWQKLGLWSSQSEGWLDQLASLWPDIKRGDTLELEVKPDKTSVFYFNGEELGRIQAPDFADSFLAIWLSENTEYPKVREQLIGRVKT